jgi:predicted HTH transcriptional regulator
LEKEVIAFLNHRDGGQIHLGLDDLGTVVGLSDTDGTQLQVKDRLKHNIQPSCLGLFDMVLENTDGKDWLRLIVASGSEKPYYLRKQGMSPRGCFIRIGSAAEPLELRQIDQLFASRTRNSIGRIKAPRQDLSFTQLKIYYEGSGHPLGAQFASNLELLTEDGDYNYAAYLLADRNGISIKMAKYAGTDRVDLIESEEYGNCCLIKATHQVLDRLEVENRTLTRITSKQRQEQRLYHPVALREAVINAIIHNDYSYEGVPKFEFFADRLEITSTGGVPLGLNQTEFFQGYSMPRNKELMRIFRNLDMVEHLGSGIPRILKAYSKDCFHFTENFLRMVYPSTVKTLVETLVETPVEASVKASVETSVETSVEILNYLSQNPKMTLAEVAQKIGRSVRAIELATAKLTKEKKLRRIGPKKGGHWQVLP